jgi:hypothetical protein
MIVQRNKYKTTWYEVYKVFKANKQDKHFTEDSISCIIH